MFVSDRKEVSSWKGFTLIMPAVSVGNVGQLACDLLIQTLALSKAGCLHHRSLQPLCGNDAFVAAGVSSGELVTSCEVYESREKKIVVIQQRAALVKGRAAEFREKLLGWIQEVGFSKVVLLTSCFAYEKTDAHIERGSLRYLTTPSLDARKDDFVSAVAKGMRLEKKRREEGVESPLQPEDIPDAAKDVHLPGGGIAEKLFTDCCTKDIPLAVLLLFCSEGDNTPDAMMMASYVNSLLQLIPEPTNMPPGMPPWRAMWRAPASWTLLFGRPANPTIY